MPGRKLTTARSLVTAVLVAVMFVVALFPPGICARQILLDDNCCRTDLTAAPLPAEPPCCAKHAACSSEQPPAESESESDSSTCYWVPRHLATQPERESSSSDAIQLVPLPAFALTLQNHLLHADNSAPANFPGGAVPPAPALPRQLNCVFRI